MDVSENNDYWNKIPLWNEKNPQRSFNILPDINHGRIPITRLESWRDFTQLLEHDFFNNSNVELVFRGHRRYDWGLTPTLGRLTNNDIITEEIRCKQIALFRKAIRGRTQDYNLLEGLSDENELWSVGQHHGLMTPLLDWTYSPYVALFFAFSKEDQVSEMDNPYRAIYVINKSFIEDIDLCPDIELFEPKKDDHGRLVSQAGLFTVAPIDSTIENKLIDLITGDDFHEKDLLEAGLDENGINEDEPFIIAKYICKIYIKNEDQHGCLKYLRLMNVHHASLFPDLIGASDYCNAYLSEHIRDKKEKVESVYECIPSDPSTFVAEVSPKNKEKTSDNIEGITYILKASIRSEISSSAISTMVTEISKILAKGKLLDWQEREALQAEMKAKIKIILRKFNYPDYARITVTNKIIEEEIKNERR